MSENGKKPLLQPVDASAITLAARLLREARHCALAVLEPGSGHPMASRATVAIAGDGAPVLLLSQLSSHTQALAADPRCSLLLGEPGGGDPLAYPRITILGKAMELSRDDPDHVDVRQRFLETHPKAALYVDFGDFAFWRIGAQRASMNAGFGRAYQFDADSLAAVLQQARSG